MRRCRPGQARVAHFAAHRLQEDLDTALSGSNSRSTAPSDDYDADAIKDKLKSTPDRLMDTSAIISHGREYMKSGLNIARPQITDQDYRSALAKGVKLPAGALDIPTVPDSVDRDLIDKVRSLLTGRKYGDYQDSVIGATALERHEILVTSDKNLRKAVNKLGGTAIDPNDEMPKAPKEPQVGGPQQ
jgi:hypothetical protein